MLGTLRYCTHPYISMVESSGGSEKSSALREVPPSFTIHFRASFEFRRSRRVRYASKRVTVQAASLDVTFTSRQVHQPFRYLSHAGSPELSSSYARIPERRCGVNLPRIASHAPLAFTPKKGPSNWHSRSILHVRTPLNAALHYWR